MFSVLAKSNITQDGVDYIASAVLDYISKSENVEKLMADFEERTRRFYLDIDNAKRREEVYEWFDKNHIVPITFYNIRWDYLNDDKINKLLSDAFNNEIDINNIVIQAIANGTILIPHTDGGNRCGKVYNMPIYNFANSKTNFYTRNENVPNSQVYSLDEVTLISANQYTPLHIHELDASIIHSVTLDKPGTRIMLSAFR